MPSKHASKIANPGRAGTNCGRGRQEHPVYVATVTLVEAIVAVRDDRQAQDHAAHALCVVAKALHARSCRLRDTVEPELHRGYEAAELLIAEHRRAA